MICKKIWERHLFCTTIQKLLLFLASMFSVYILIDYSVHIQDFIKHASLSWSLIGNYYLMMFFKRLVLFLPLALIMSTVNVLTKINKHNELLALQVSGISSSQICRPFFIIGLICTIFTYCNLQFITPISTIKINAFEKEYFNKIKKTSKANRYLHPVFLEDNSRLIYQTYSPTDNMFFDVFWIRSLDDIYHIKYLYLNQNTSTGKYIDHIKRTESGKLEKITSYEDYVFQDLKINKEFQKYFALSIEDQSLSTLFQILMTKHPFFKDKQATINTHLYYKLFIPWISIIMLIIIFPFCLVPNRRLSVPLLFTLSVFGFIGFFTIINACIVLGEIQIIPPYIAIFFLPSLLLISFGKRFFKKCLL